jgi:hypothetical protein
MSDLYLRSSVDKSESALDPDLRLRSAEDKEPAGVTIVGEAEHSQPAQGQDGTGLYFIEAEGSHSQEPQTSEATGVYLLTGTAAHSQKRQTSSAIGNNNSIPVVVAKRGGSRPRRYYIPTISGGGYAKQSRQKQWVFGDLIIKAFSAMWQKKSHSKAAGGMCIIGKGENKKLRQIEKTYGFTVNAEDELITILKLLDVA